MIRRVVAGSRTRMRGAVHRRLARRPADVDLDTPVVSFTFDDAPLSAYTVGARALDRHGWRGTFYVAGSLLGKEYGDEIALDVEDVAALHASGHEVGCHTFSHTPPAGLARAEVASDLARNAVRLGELVPGLTLASFAYPFGEVTVALKREVRARFFSARGIRSGVNAGTVDLMLLRANRLYGADPDLELVDRLLDDAHRQRGWIIFYTHDVAERPGRYGCTARHLEAVIERVRTSGATVLPVRDAVTSATTT